MRNQSLYRIGGNALLAGAVLNAVAFLLHVPQPMDLAAFAAAASGRWIAAHWLFAVGTFFLVGGLFALSRHLFTTRSEGWAALGWGATVVSGAAFIAIVAPEIAAFPALAQGGPGSETAYHAINLNLMSLVHVAAPIFWAGVICYAVAMMSDDAFPRWLGQSGAAIGAIAILTSFLLAQNWIVFKLVLVAGYAWLAFAGYTFGRVRAPVHA